MRSPRAGLIGGYHRRSRILTHILMYIVIPPAGWSIKIRRVGIVLLFFPRSNKAATEERRHAAGNPRAVARVNEQLSVLRRELVERHSIRD